MIKFIKKVTPSWAFPVYHRILSTLANYYYGQPSEELIVIGVTGTNGKTSVCDYTARVLEGAGHKVGVASTAMFKIAGNESLNNKKMTMLGRFALQSLLRKMVKAGCSYAVIETSSQGVEQFRHLGVHYDICIFTNLTPEHIEAHGGFENYKKAKLKLFKHLEGLPTKKLPCLRHPELAKDLAAKTWDPSLPQDDGGKALVCNVNKAIIVNGDDKVAGEFLNFKIDQKIVFGISNENQEFSIFNFQFSNEFLPAGRQVQGLNVQNIKYNSAGVSFVLDGIQFDLKLFGKFSVYNTLAAIAVAKTQGIDLKSCKNSLEKVAGVPGRMEFIETGKDFKVLVDYAPEPESMRQLFATIKDHKMVTGKVIHVFGSCGGGRDVGRRPILGELSAQNADVLIITNEDPYDDDPQVIIDDVAEGAIKAGKVLGNNIFKISDRHEAIKFALEQAQPGDLVLLTGKGCEQAICVADGCKVQWDEREVARQLLNLKN